MDAETSAALDQFFLGRDSSRAIFEAVRRAVEADGPADAVLPEDTVRDGVADCAMEIRTSRSQVAFCRGRIFDRVWLQEQYLGRGAPLVLTLGFRRRDPSPRWKSVVEPYPGRFTHHLELYSPQEVDDEVRAWLHEV